MITQKQIRDILETYNPNDITIGALGGHSALDVCHGAKKYGFRTVVVAQKGREKTYEKYYKTKDGRGCVDELIVVDKFKDVVKPEVQKRLLELNTLFLHNRYFWVYCNFEEIENDFKVPIMGSRTMLKFEERDIPGNQYEILQRAGIRIPKIFGSYKEIDRMVIVKVSEALRGYERAFFYVSTPEDFQHKSQELLREGLITEEFLNKAVIEEYVIGAPVNFNYFYSVINDELELIGTDTRRQTNLDGILRLPAIQQMKIADFVEPTIIETGHIACTVKESILEKIFDLGEKFVATTKETNAPGIIGAFALQGAMSSEKGREDPVIFDVSMRIPGSPGTRFTPYSGYKFGESISVGERIAMEIRDAIDQKRLHEICT